MVKICGNANCKKEGIHKCSNCDIEMYCSKECQKSSWSKHKSSCQQIVAKTFTSKNFNEMTIKQLKYILKTKASAFESDKKKYIMGQHSDDMEKSALITLVSKYVKSDEIEGILSGSTSWKEDISASSSSSRYQGPSDKARRNLKSKSGKQPTPSPDQLRQQAKYMRSNPAGVRSQNAAFAKMTDAQIIEYADTIEKTASDPELMKEVAKMSNYSEADRQSLQGIQEAVAGHRKMDIAWIENTVDSFKKNPSLFKSTLAGKGAALGNVSDDQINSFIDFISSIDRYYLILVVRFIVYCTTIYPTVMEVYKLADKYTLGMIKYILLAMLFAVFWYCSKGTFYFWRFIIRKILNLIGYGTVGGTSANAIKDAVSSVATPVAETIQNIAENAEEFEF
jgi:hypothetical protein